MREVPRRVPAADEIEIVVEATSVNPIDVRRAGGYGRRLLSLLGASRFPMTLGNDFAGTIVAAGKGCEQTLTVGDRVYGVKPVSRDGSHTSHLLVKGAYARKAPPERQHPESGCAAVFLRDDVDAMKAAGLTRENVQGRDCSRAWSGGRFRNAGLADPVGMGSQSNRHRQGGRPPACYAAGATEAIDRNQNPFATRGARSTPPSTSPHGTTS